VTTATATRRPLVQNANVYVLPGIDRLPGYGYQRNARFLVCCWFGRWYYTDSSVDSIYV
jgi:hypothetical protein